MTSLKATKLIIFFTLIFAVFFYLKKPSPPQNQFYLQSFFNNKNQYQQSFQKYKNSPKKNITAGIISHHFLAKDLISQFFAGINPTGIKNVYLVGPDHFHITSAPITTTSYPWHTPFSNLSANLANIKKLTQDPQIENNYLAFTNEHSIYTLIPFVKYFFSNASVTPLVLNTSKDLDYFYNFGKTLNPKNSILIISSDFSHQSTPAQANQNDQASIEALSAQNIDKIEDITCDCRQCIALLYGYLQNQSSTFDFIANTTSQNYGETDLTNLTSYLSAYFISKSLNLF